MGALITGTPTGELSLLIRCIMDACLGRRATTAATMAFAPTTAFDWTPDAGCTWIDRVSMGLVGAELLVCSSGFSMVATSDLAPGEGRSLQR